MCINFIGAPTVPPTSWLPEGRANSCPLRGLDPLPYGSNEVSKRNIDILSFKTLHCRGTAGSSTFFECPKGILIYCQCKELSPSTRWNKNHILIYIMNFYKSLGLYEDSPMILLKNTLLIFILSFVFLQIPNKSNIPKEYMIPLIIALTTKYTIGDLDKGYQYTVSDIFYWIYILVIPYIIVLYWR